MHILIFQLWKIQVPEIVYSVYKVYTFVHGYGAMVPSRYRGPKIKNGHAANMTVKKWKKARRAI